MHQQLLMAREQPMVRYIFGTKLWFHKFPGDIPGRLDGIYLGEAILLHNKTGWRRNTSSRRPVAAIVRRAQANNPLS